VLVTEGTGTMLLPLVLRTIPGGGRDAVSPYGYPGPIVAGTDDPTFLERALRAAKDHLAEETVISLFVRMHPLLNPVPPEGVGTIVRHGDTVTVDLSRDAETIWCEIRKDHRKQIRRSMEAGHTVRIRREDAAMSDFQRLYRQTMDRMGASVYYRFDDTYFGRLRAALGERLHVGVTEIDGEIASAVLLVETCGIVQSHLTGSDQRFARSAPTKILDYRQIVWARDRGDRWLHLGGGRGGASDSLMLYKAGFSPLRTPFHTIRAILLEDRYEDLVAAHLPELDPWDMTGHFPVYRRSLQGW
jgi:hypothetical protein